jgi:hypothetical protein
MRTETAICGSRMSIKTERALFSSSPATCVLEWLYVGVCFAIALSVEMSTQERPGSVRLRTSSV